MKTFKKLRKAWHDLYYKNASPRRVEFGLRCQNVTEWIDLRHKPESLPDRFRFALHLSLCQSCRTYHGLSQALSKAIRRFVKTKQASIDLPRYNQELVKRFKDTLKGENEKDLWPGP